jgi:hypothetical protein
MKTVAWRSAIVLIIWISEIVLLTFPNICNSVSICANYPVKLIIILGIIASVIALSDAKLIKNKAREWFK